MTVPVVVPRAEHAISRKLVDPDALKVLYRLHQNNYAAYLVGGSVRDLLLGRRPKDFDIGTSAHPYQVKRLFRNCWIIGRRFRLAHVRFGMKAIEVATFRRQLTAAELAAPEDPAVPKQPLHLVGVRAGADVEVFRAAAKQQIAHAAAHEIRRIVILVETIENLQRIGIDKFAGDRVFGARYDHRNRHRSAL